MKKKATEIKPEEGLQSNYKGPCWPFSHLYSKLFESFKERDYMISVTFAKKRHRKVGTVKPLVGTHPCFILGCLGLSPWLCFWSSFLIIHVLGHKYFRACHPPGNPRWRFWLLALSWHRFCCCGGICRSEPVDSRIFLSLLVTLAFRFKKEID